MSADLRLVKRGFYFQISRVLRGLSLEIMPQIVCVGRESHDGIPNSNHNIA
jgi:hypothetical protein